MIITVFLGIFVLALLIGNGLLFFIPKKTSEKTVPSAQYCKNISPTQETQGPGGTNSAVKALVVEERINLLNKRLARLEEIGSMPSRNITTITENEFAQKILDLQEFKHNSRIEIEALKQRLAELRKELNLEPDNAKKRAETSISREKLHALAFRSN
jgi:hypothetical protein